MRKAYGFKSPECLKMALYHTLGKLPEPLCLHILYLADEPRKLEPNIFCAATTCFQKSRKSKVQYPMTNHPIISIITLTYNHEYFIGKCIDSVIAQTNADWELIVIDDGSTDRTGEIVSNYHDQRIKYVRQENRGVSRL